MLSPELERAWKLYNRLPSPSARGELHEHLKQLLDTVLENESLLHVQTRHFEEDESPRGRNAAGEQVPFWWLVVSADSLAARRRFVASTREQLAHMEAEVDSAARRVCDREGGAAASSDEALDRAQREAKAANARAGGCPPRRPPHWTASLTAALHLYVDRPIHRRAIAAESLLAARQQQAAAEAQAAERFQAARAEAEALVRAAEGAAAAASASGGYVADAWRSRGDRAPLRAARRSECCLQPQL